MDTETFLLKRQDLLAKMQQRRDYQVPGWSRLAVSFVSGLGLPRLLSGVFLPVAGSLFLNRLGRKSVKFLSKHAFLTRIFDLVSFLKV